MEDAKTIRRTTADLFMCYGESHRGEPVQSDQNINQEMEDVVGSRHDEGYPNR